MQFEELPTSEDFGEYDWRAVLAGDDRYSDVDPNAYEVLTQADKGPVTAERLVRIDKFWACNGGYAETDVALLARTSDGWLTLVAYCDTTGWDCQSGGRWHWARTRDEAIRNGLDNEGRERLGLELPK